MPLLPVWFLKAGQSEGSAVLVWVQRKGSKVAEQRLLTAQHVLRTGKDKRSGPYSTTLRAWPPGVGYQEAQGFNVDVDKELTPKDDRPLVDPEDLAFLKLPAEATGGIPTGLLADATCEPGLPNLTICGFTSGQEIIKVHAAVVRPARYTGWIYDDLLEAKSSGILSSGTGQELSGVSGGGVFQDGRYAGVYRGAFEAVGQHLFIPIPRIRSWCLQHGSELVDLSMSGHVEVIKERLSDLPGMKDVPEVKQLLDPTSREELKELRAVIAEFRIYKLLHDDLHYLLYAFPSAAKAARSNLSDDDVLEIFELAIKPIKERLPEIEKHINEIDSLAWKRTEFVWFKSLKKNVDLAGSAGHRRDTKNANEACGKIGSVLKCDLPRINGVLTRLAQAMDVGRLGTLLGKISAIPMLAAKKDDFLRSQEACAAVRQALDQQIDLHGKWQEVDVKLWEAESALFATAALGEKPENFLLQWHQIQSALKGLIAGSQGAEWAQDVTEDLTEAGVLADTRSWQPLSKKFDHLARHIRDQFFQVNGDLKTQAEKISELGKPLDAFLEATPP